MRYKQTTTDQQQFTSIENGKEKAVAELIHQHKDQLFYAAYLLVKDRTLAEDIFQDACIRVIRSIRKGNYAEEGKFVPWAARIVRNLALDHLRQRKVKIKVTLSNGGDIFDFIKSEKRNEEEEMQLSTSCKTARDLLNEIPYKQREVVVLRIYGDMNFKDIAKLTNSSVNTVLGRMRYGLINMRKLVEEKNIPI